MDSVIVLGAGLAGLGCARHLPGCRVFEAANHSGGHAYSHRVAGVAFDEGAHICHSKDRDFLNLICAAAGQVVQIEPSVVRNYCGGSWLTYPIQNHLYELPLDDRIRALADLVDAHAKPQVPEPKDYLAWCLAQYGEFLTDRFYRKYTAKYWRVAMDELATDWLGGRLLPSQLPRIVQGAFRAQREQQSTFNVFRYPARGGFFGFFEPLYAEIDVRHGERAVEVDAAAKTVTFATGRREPYEYLASSIPLPELIAITKDVPSALRDAAGCLRHTQLVCVNFLVKKPQLTENHWFYIYDEEIDASRVSVPSNLSPGCVPSEWTALQAEVFRRHDETLALDVLVERAADQVARILNFNPATEVASLSHVHVPHAYVISDHQRASSVAVLREWLEARAIFPIGLLGRWKYIWSDEAFRQGCQVAQLIKDRAGQPSPALAGQLRTAA
jgi:protoporphyrinogen oxidase